MAMSFSSAQYNDSFRAQKLCNWEMPDEANNRPLRKSPRKGKTEFIVSDNGHILPGVPKQMTAFNNNVNSSARWPQGNPAIMGSSNATMGYKGITTSYLPQSTVHLKTYELGGPENTYR